MERRHESTERSEMSAWRPQTDGALMMATLRSPKKPGGGWWTAGERETDAGLRIYGEFSIIDATQLDRFIKQIKSLRKRLKKGRNRRRG